MPLSFAFIQNTEISQVLSKFGWKWLLPIPFDPQWKQLWGVC